MDAGLTVAATGYLALVVAFAHIAFSVRFVVDMSENIKKEFVKCVFRN